jgi:hypothetical protein
MDFIVRDIVFDGWFQLEEESARGKTECPSKSWEVRVGTKCSVDQMDQMDAPMKITSA